jgi:hypothetical protein
LIKYSINLCIFCFFIRKLQSNVLDQIGNYTQMIIDVLWFIIEYYVIHHTCNFFWQAQIYIILFFNKKEIHSGNDSKVQRLAQAMTALASVWATIFACDTCNWLILKWYSYLIVNVSLGLLSHQWLRIVTHVTYWT